MLAPAWRVSSLAVCAISLLAFIPPTLSVTRTFQLSDRVITTPLTLSTTMAPRLTGGRGGKGSGFINQHLKLLTLLTMAIYLKVDTVILPQATSRDSWEVAEPTWRSQPAHSLWDVESIEQLLAQHNITMRQGTDEDDPPAGAVMLPSYFCRVVDVAFLASEVERHCRMHLAKSPLQPAAVTPLVIYAPDLILALRTDHLPLYAQVGRAVRFAKPLVAMADHIIGKLRRVAAGYNGLHLRVEGDFREVHNVTLMQGLASYGAKIRQLNFSNSPLYIASAIFVEGGAVDLDRYHEVDVWLRALMAAGHASSLANGRLLVHNDTSDLPLRFAALHSEQRAALDYLVLMHADQLVGTRMSSFSFALREYRALRNVSRATTGVVGGVWNLFRYAAAFAVPGR